MGLTHVTVAISNPADRARNWEGLFLVDTGAIDCMAPANALFDIGIKPEGKKTYELADGTEVQFEFGLARIEFLGDVAGGIIIFGPDDCEPILGVTALESTGIVVDPKSNQLKRLPAVPLK
ncbi:MAG: clan AA aspartic protease [Pirellulales bacterium]